MTILELYKEALLEGTTNERSAARRYWLRAVVETLHERSLTAVPKPSRRPREGMISVERFEPFWHKVPDDELYDFLKYVTPFFRRPENRGIPL